MVGACSAVDALGRMLFSSTCLSKSAAENSWGTGSVLELDNASVVPVCDDSRVSSDTGKARRNVRFSEISTILSTSPSSASAGTASTRSSHISFDNDELFYRFHVSHPLPSSDVSLSSSIEEFIEIEVAASSCSSTSRLRLNSEKYEHQDRDQEHQRKQRHPKRNRFLGHSKRKQRVRQILKEDIAHRKRRSEKILDLKRYSRWKGTVTQ